MNNPYSGSQQRPPQYNQPLISQQYPNQGMQPGNFIQNQNYPANIANQPQINVNQQQLFQQYAASSSNPGGRTPIQSPQYAENQQVYFPPPQPQSPPNGLMPPPQLRQERDHDQVTDPARGSNVMHQSSNEQQVRDIVWGQQQQVNAFWEQKFFLIYQKFQWFGSRFEMLKGEYMAISQQLHTVDSQQDWNQLKQHHEQFAQKLQQMFQQLIAVADENQQLINQRLQQDDGVWQRRYHQLLSNFKALQQKSSILQLQNQDLKVNNNNEQNNQQQNYPQLLSHYRNLQQQYERLYNAYNKLQQENQHIKTKIQGKQGPSLEDFENMRLEYQNTLEKMNMENQGLRNQNQGLRSQCQQFYQQNQHLKQQLHHNSQFDRQKQELTRHMQQKQYQNQQLLNDLDEYKRRYESIQKQYKILLVQKQQNNSQQKLTIMEKQIQLLKQQNKTKQSQNLLIKKKLQDEIRQRQQLLHDNQAQIQKAIKLQAEKHIRQKQVIQKQLSTLHQQYDLLLKQSNQKSMSKYQIQTQQKRIHLLKDQNNQLIQQIKLKNQQLRQLRNVSLQIVTYQNILEQYKVIEKEKLQLEEINRKLNNQTNQYKRKINQLQHQYTEYKNITVSSSLKTNKLNQVKQLQSQIYNKRQQIQKLQSELNKYKKIIQSKQNYIRDIQSQNTKLLIQLQKLSKQSQLLKQQSRHKSLQLQRKIQSLQKINKINQLQFKKQFIQHYEKQIQQLRHNIEDKNKIIKRLQNNINQVNTQFVINKKYSSSHNDEFNLLNNKLSSLENYNTQLLNKLTHSSTTIQSLQHQLESYKQKQSSLKAQINNYLVQIQEADTLIKNKNHIITEYQNQVQQFVEKVTLLEGRIDGQRKEKFQRIKKYQQEIQKLKQRIYNPQQQSSKRDSFGGSHYRYNSSYSSQTYSNRYLTFGTKQPQNQKSQQITKLQTNIIQQLNEQNAKLRTQLLQLTKKNHQLQSLSRIVPKLQQQLQSPKKSSPSKSKLSQIPQKDVGLNLFVQERLMKFNQRLENCIHDNQLIAVRDVDLTASQRIANNQRQKRQLQNQYMKQVKSLKQQNNKLKQQINQLSNQLSNNQTQSPQAAPLMDSDLKQFDKYNILQQQKQKTTQQQLQFYKQKLKDQQKTNSILIKLNQQLKKQLQQSINKKSQSTLNYYKIQYKQYQKQLQEQKAKSKKLFDQNQLLKHENLQHDTKLIKDYQIKLFNIELQFKQLQRENNYYKMLKNKLENQKANLLHDINVYVADIQTIKVNTQNKIHQYEKVNQELKQKCNNMEKQLFQNNHKFNSSQINSQYNSRLVNSNDKLRFSSGRKVFA